MGVLILNHHQLTDVAQEQLVRAKESLIKVAKAIEERLKTRTFLVGDSLSIADISAFFSWKEVCQVVEKESKDLGCLRRWSNYIASVPLK